MPKPNKKTRGGKPRNKENNKNGNRKKRVRHADPCVNKEINMHIDALVEEIEKPDVVEETPKVPGRQQKKLISQDVEDLGLKLKLKPGTTIAQAKMLAEQKLKKSQGALQNSEDGKTAVEELGDEEEECEASDEDYSDTANERPSEYRKGGYHPVEVGDVYNDRYRVVRKLGWGYFSTVWLVWDYVNEKYQAMKVQKSARHYTEAAYDEIKLLGEIMAADPENERRCARLNDYFERSGPNGIHVCMVFDVYGEDLLSLIERYKYNGVPLPIVKCIARQILVALEHVHSLDIIHTDLKPENVLLSTPKHAVMSHMKRFRPPPLHERPRLVTRDPKTMTKSQRRRYYKKIRAAGRSKEADPSPESENSGGAKQEEGDTPKDPEEEHMEENSISETDSEWEIERLHHVVLADFGNSCWTYRQFTDEVQTRQYRSPEVILGYPYSTPIDLWSAACMIFELITGEFLFDPRKDSNYSRDEDHLALISELLGELPRHMRFGDGKYRSQYYNSRGELRSIKDLNFWALEDVLYRKHKFTRKKAAEIAEFLLPMLELEPRKRATASEMLANFEHFFEIMEDDYSPLCFVATANDEKEGCCSNNSEGSELSSAYEDAGYDGRSGNQIQSSDEVAECYADEEDTVVAQYLERHPILSEQSLAKYGLTVLDIQAVLSGKRLEDKKAHAAATEIIRMLTEDGCSDADVEAGSSSSTDVERAGGGSSV